MKKHRLDDSLFATPEKVLPTSTLLLLFIGVAGVTATVVVGVKALQWAHDPQPAVFNEWVEVNDVGADAEPAEVVTTTAPPHESHLYGTVSVEELEPMWTVDTHTGPFIDDELRRVRIAVDVLTANHSRGRHFSLEHRQDIAQMAIDAAEQVELRSGRTIDPVDLVIIWRFESGFRWTAIGDGGVSCGALQIRTDFDGRPSCESLHNPAVSLLWAANELASISERDGGARINRYNGGGHGAMQYGARHHLTYALIERAVNGDEFDVRMYEHACEVLR